MPNRTEQKIKRLKSNWYVWLFPVFAMMIAGYLFSTYFEQQGPEIRITFDDASGIQPEKTRVRYRGVTIGIVKGVTISNDGKDAVARVQLQRDAEDFAVEGSDFWIVKPKVDFQGVSGLETLFEGTFIAVQPGKSDADPKRDFKGKVGHESSDPVEDTSAYYLETPNAESYNPGDAITYRGVKVGSITKVHFSKTAQTVLLQINIENRFVRLVRANSVFWRKVAVQAKLGLFNSELKINSMDTVLHGGIEFFTPDDVGPRAKGGSKFALGNGPPKGSEKWNPKID